MIKLLILFIALLTVSCSKDISIDEHEPVAVDRFKVSVVDGEVSVVRHYVTDHDLEVTIGACGVNHLAQIKQLSYIHNTSQQIADTGSNGLRYVSYSDWVGPYWMVAVANGNENSGFTGGWHGCDGDLSGSPTARTASISTIIDGQPLTADISNRPCRDVHVVVENLLQAGNTKQADGHGREVLRETVDYHFHADTLSVSVSSEALEDIVIQNYYGLQSCFGGTVRMACHDTIYTFRNDGYHGPQQRVSAADCIRSDGHQVRCLLDSVGLGTQQRYNQCPTDPERQYCFTSPYDKTYFRLVGEVGLPLSKGQTVFWSGAYIFSERR